MAAPTYSTDLAVLASGADGESGTWVEMAWNNGGTPQVNTTEWFIQGAGCVTATMNNKTTIQSIAFNAGSDISSYFTSNICFFMWQVCLAGNAIDTFDNGGLRAIIGVDINNFGGWKTGGSNFGRNPYGGWQNVAIYPGYNSNTPDYTNGTFTPGTSAYQYFGSGLLPSGAVSKGEMHCVDALRYGRGQIKAINGDGTSGYATFAGMAQYNDYNDATNGYNRFGLFQFLGGKQYLWKGLMSLDDVSNAVDFRDSDRDITVDDTPRTYTAFNRIEINNASSNIEWTRVNFTALNSSGLSRGQFEMVANASLSWTACNFSGMSTFIFQSNASLTRCNWIGCEQITHGGGDFEACGFQGYEGTAGTGYLTYNIAADPDGELDNCSFTKGTASTHAIQFGTSTPTTMTLRGLSFSGYNASNEQNDSTLYFPDTGSDVTWTVNLVGCSGNISYRKARAGDTVSFVTNPVTTKVTAKDANTGSVIENAMVVLFVTDGTNYPYQDSVSITRSGSTATVSHTAHGLVTNDKVLIDGANQPEYNGVRQITKIDDNSYSYTVSGTPATPATGTIISTYVPLQGLTDSGGIRQASKSFPSGNQPVSGWVRKSTSTPLYKPFPLSGEINSTSGLSIVAPLTRDD